MRAAAVAVVAGKGERARSGLQQQTGAGHDAVIGQDVAGIDTETAGAAERDAPLGRQREGGRGRQGAAVDHQFAGRDAGGRSTQAGVAVDGQCAAADGGDAGVGAAASEGQYVEAGLGQAACAADDAAEGGIGIGATGGEGRRAQGDGSRAGNVAHRFAVTGQVPGGATGHRDSAIVRQHATGTRGERAEIDLRVAVRVATIENDIAGDLVGAADGQRIAADDARHGEDAAPPHQPAHAADVDAAIGVQGERNVGIDLAAEANVAGVKAGRNRTKIGVAVEADHAIAVDSRAAAVGIGTGEEDVVITGAAGGGQKAAAGDDAGQSEHPGASHATKVAPAGAQRDAAIGVE